MYQVKEITNKQEWEKFVLAQEFTPMTQSYKYGEFYQKMNEEFWIFGVYENEVLVAGLLVLSMHAKRGNFLFVPYGPFSKKNDPEIIRILVDHLKNFAQINKYMCVRISPFVEDSTQMRKISALFGFRNSPIHALAETTWLLDLRQKEEDIFTQMEKSHRNLIRRCIKEGVRIEKSNDISKLKEFNSLHDVTAKRHNFVRFSDEYVRKEFESFASDNEVLVLCAYLPDGRLDSAAVVYFYGNMAAYRHGASLTLDKKVPTSYLLQWTAIQEAKKRGITYYNFWGIAPDGAQKSHPFSGITHFKKGFGGFQKNLLPCQDLIISPLYWFNWIIETLRRAKRGF